MLIGSVVLAGGDSGRMGSSKASLEWNGSALLTDRVDMLLDYTYPVVAVLRNRDQELPPLNTEGELAYDSIADGGPLVGVLAGMEALATRCDAAIVIGCDFPFVDSRTIDWLVNQLGDANGAVPNPGKPQPLCAIYRTSLLPAIRQLVDGGARAAHALLDLDGVRQIDDAQVTAFDAERRFLWNINTPEDYEKARSWTS